MKIALLTDGISPFVIGGMQKHSFYLCKFLAQNKIHVHLYHTAPDLNVVDLCKYFTPDELIYIESILIPFPSSGRYPGHYIYSSFAYSKLVYENMMMYEPVDLIYAKGLTSWYLLKHGMPGRSNTPVCINVHGYEYFQKAASFKTWLEQLIVRPVFRYINEKADYIYSYGGRITEIINKNIKRRKGSIIEIPAGISSDYVSNLEPFINQPRKFIFVGRYERRKGIKELISAFSNLINTYSFELQFIGDAPERARLNSTHITYHGVLNDKTLIQDLLRNADVLVCPSYSEGMPNVILEAMAAGCAIIGTDVGAVSVQVNAENGWLIEPGSVPALEQAMAAAIQMPEEKLKKLKLNSIEKIKASFLWEHIILGHISSFNSILKSSAGNKSTVIVSHNDKV